MTQDTGLIMSPDSSWTSTPTRPTLARSSHDDDDDDDEDDDDDHDDDDHRARASRFQGQASRARDAFDERRARDGRSR